MARDVTTHLMFEGAAGEAMALYTSLFDDSRIEQVEKYGPGERGPEGSVKLARFSLAGREFLRIDSPVKHAFTFTPAMSIFVDCESEAELDAAFARLSEGGAVLMPVGNYGFSARFGWLTDRFGVSWQLNLPYSGSRSDRAREDGPDYGRLGLDPAIVLGLGRDPAYAHPGRVPREREPL